MTRLLLVVESLRLVAVAVAVVVSVAASLARADELDVLYNAVFRFSQTALSSAQVADALARLHSPTDGLRYNDPRRDEVSQWVEVSRDAVSKCTRDYDERVLLDLQHYRFVAEEERRGGEPAAERAEPRGQHFNLEAYVVHHRAERLAYCEYKIGLPLMGELREATRRSLSSLMQLTKPYLNGDKPNVMGRRVGELLVGRLDRMSLTQLTESLDDLDFVKEVYARHSPCTAVLRVADKYADYCALLAVSYRQSRRGLREWLDRIDTCRYIAQTRQVFDAAAEFLHERSSQRDRAARASRARANDNRYDLVFRYSDEQMTATGVTIALVRLDSYRYGLLADDPRREEVGFWLRAATPADESKCTGDEDALLLAQLRQARSMADQAGQLDVRHWFQGSDGVLNLEVYVKHLRLERLLFCELSYGRRVMDELQQWKADNFRDAISLTMGFRHGGPVDADELGRRVGALIARKAGRDAVRQIAESAPQVDVELIRQHYGRWSPCASLLRIRDRHDGYYRLIAAPDNYQALSAALTSFVDKISVCSFIDASDDVFRAAGRSLRDEVMTDK